ncbi:MAG: GntR family transcriptional regulator, partial [Desulfobulbia bacterium]
FVVGDLLPTESKLIAHYNVSRHTARHAIRELRNRGLVLSRQGRGSEVVQTSSDFAFSENVQSIEALVQFATETRLFFGAGKAIQVNKNLAKRLGCEPGRRFVRMDAVRQKKVEKSEITIAVAEIYLDELYASIINKLNDIQGSTAVYIAENFGFHVQEVQQEVTATLISPRTAEQLNVKSGSAGLVVTRRYYSDQKNLFLIAVSIYDALHAKISSHYSAHSEPLSG